MQGEINKAERENERIQIRAFWISNKQTPLVYKYFKNKSFANKGDMVFEIRDALATGVMLNNLVPGLASFIGSLGDKLTLEKVMSFITLMTEHTEPSKGLSNHEIEEIVNRLHSKLSMDRQTDPALSQDDEHLRRCTGNTSSSEGADSHKESFDGGNSPYPKIAVPVTNTDKADYSHSFSKNDINSENRTSHSSEFGFRNVESVSGNQIDSAPSQDASLKRTIVRRNRQPLNQLGNLSK